MPFLLLASILGMLTYVVISRSVANITRTPTWLLWLVMMTPVFVLTAWLVVNGTEEKPPLGLLYGLFILCPLVYAILIYAGRKTPPKSAEFPKNEPKSAPAKPISQDEESLLQRCFPWTVYYLQKIEYRPQAMICRGQLRTSPGKAYQAIQQNVKNSFGDRFLVLFQEGLNGRPFFALVPNPQAQPAEGRRGKARDRDSPLTRPGLALTLVIITLVTTTMAGITYVGETPIAEAWSNRTALWSGLAYGLSLMFILGVHETGHYLAARHYRLKATLPYFIPVPFFLGTFGAFIQMKAPIPNRRALFDVGIAGPLSGLVVTLPILLWGLAHSTVIELTDEASLLNFEALDPSASVILAVISKLALGASLQVDSAISLHPVAVAGCLGLVVTALNLMPVGQLDGGHIVHAMYGQRTGAIVGQIARLLVLVLAFIHEEFLLWAILLFFIPADEPALNDVSELDGRRDLLGLIALALLVMIVLPAPSALTQLLF
ncbi:site-2 protease family protein [Romeria aff. gracilis LEGE 07310]|uniref:Site-2 protease family protein n=1 Tax=Vasconcelosia minhoensis LEGE 07310 TaxID=915328 RepID=A0A8J7ABW0_9CYAN|nr:site-2 protease family protein [Romeria gracilis]MBE9080185.1 site-2 protease family protein [Romeria aff. gracilis LEGE 07310]